ncbi:MAG: NAD-dependent protein deacylase [Candidatus Omnitrophica bacterium]|nr:NAD-dependent protein deacylase [Candidatus Omnitrophota bacterium]
MIELKAQSARSIVILTGAGISAESGIQTFRAQGGLWEDYRVEDVASPRGFERDPELVHRFYNERRRRLLKGEVKPNAAHLALARLEREFPGQVLLVTQNIDNLHEEAGSREVIHMHGEILKSRCVLSEEVFDCERDLSVQDRCSCCAPPNPLRPHVVWFGETPLGLDRIFGALHRADLFIAVGTSGHVYPAAGFVEEARAAHAHTVELNLEPSAVRSSFLERLYGPATEVVPGYVKSLLEVT